jgi:hypothetical protein
MLGRWYWRVCKVPTDSELVRFSGMTGSEWRTVKLTRLTQLRHWQCTAAMVLMPVSPLLKYLFEPLRYRLPSMGRRCDGANS